MFFQLACLPPPCPLSVFPLLVGVMGECKGTRVGAHGWVLGSMPTMGVLSALGAYWLACFRWNPYDILGTQPSFPYGIYSYLFKLSNEWLRLMKKTTRSKHQFIYKIMIIKPVNFSLLVFVADDRQICRESFHCLRGCAV